MSSRRRLLPLVFGVAAVVAMSQSATAIAADPDAARAILRERDQRQRPQTEEHVGEVVVIARDGRERRKTWRSFRAGPAGDYDRMIRFLSPPDVRGVGYLAHFRPAKAPDEWLYLPSMKRERRISARDRDGAFAGTSFSYEDLDLMELDETRYDAALLSTGLVGGVRVHVIELTPRIASAYAKKVVTLRVEDLAVLSVEFFVARVASPVKRMTFSNHTPIAGYRRPTRIEMTDLRKGGRTVVTLHDVVLDRPQPPDRFTIRNLLREDDETAPAGRTRPSFFRQQPGTGPAPASSGLALPGGFTGYVEGRGFGFFGDRAARNTNVWGTVFLRQTLRVGHARIAAAVRLERTASTQVRTIAFNPADRQPERSVVSLRELSLQAPLGASVDVQAGRFVTSWGQTDGYSPADAFFPRDLTEPLTEDRLPLWGVRLRGERGAVRFEVLAVPITTPWRLPQLGGRQSPLAALEVTIDERPFTVPTSGFGAGRIIGRVGDWDAGVWIRTGTRPAPVLDPNLDGATTTADVVIVPLERRFATEHAAGGSLSRDVGGWIVHTELGVFRSSDEALGDAAIVTFGASRLLPKGSFTATIATNAIEPPVNPLLIFDRALLPCVIMAVHSLESWGSWDAGWVATFRTVGGVLSTAVSKDLNDTLKATLGIELPHGAALSPATAFSGGQRVRAGLRWSW